MGRDIEADVKVNDKTKPGLDSVSRNFKKTGKDIEKEYDRFGKSTGDKLIRGIGAVSPKLAASLAKGIGDSASLGAPLLISGVASALPVLSGLIGAAVTGGAAGAGIIGGVALASRDARVKQAGTVLGENLFADLTQKADGFVQPILQSIGLISDKFRETGSTIDSIFDNSAKFLVPLTSSVLEFTQDIAEGIDIAVGRAGPVMESLGNGVELLGDTIKGFLDNLSVNAEGNAVILDESFSAIAGTLNLLGTALAGVTYIFEQFDKIMPLSLLGQLNDLFDGTTDSARRTQGGTFGAADGIRTAGDAAETSAADTKLYEQALKDNAKAAEDAANAQRSLFDDLTKVGDATDKASASAKKNGRTLSENTAKGRANRESLSNLASAMNGYRGNLEKAGRSTSAVNGVLNTQRNRLIAAAQSMGATKSEARRLADQLLGIKPRSVSVKVTGSAAAASNARNVRQEIEQVKSKTVSVNVVVNASRLAAVERRLARVSGGNSAAGQTFGELVAGQRARTGGATEVNATVQNTILLDGRPFRRYTDQVVARKNFRDKVGRR